MNKKKGKEENKLGYFFVVLWKKPPPKPDYKSPKMASLPIIIKNMRKRKKKARERKITLLVVGRSFFILKNGSTEIDLTITNERSALRKE